MADPRFPRQFSFRELDGLSYPLFSEESPWRQRVSFEDQSDNVPTHADSLAQSMKTYWVLAQYHMMFALSDDLSKGFADQSSLPITDDIRSGFAMETLVDGHCRTIYRGGKNQILQFSVGDYTFPIYDARDGDQPPHLGDLLIRNYDDATSWNPYQIWHDWSENHAGLFIAHGVPYPPGEFRPGGGDPATEADGNIVLIDRAEGKMFDFWQTTNSRQQDGKNLGGGHVGRWVGDGAVSAQAGGVTSFLINGLGARKDGQPVESGVRASGLPYLGGCLLPEDFSNGVDSVIEHAFAFSLPRSRLLRQPGVMSDGKGRDFVAPATRTEEFEGLPHRHALAAGQRIRLQDPIRFWDGRAIQIEDIPIPVTRIVCRALRDYGAYLVDGAGGFSFYAEHKDTGVIAPEVALSLATPVGKVLEDGIPSKETPWEFLVNEINADLSWRLFRTDTLKEGVPFGFFYETADEAGSQLHFESNFEIVEDFAW